MSAHDWKARGISLLAGLTLLACSFVTRILIPQANDSSPSKKDLIALSGVDGNIYTVDPLGNNQIAITQDANLQPDEGEMGRIYQYPTWAPDSTRLAFLGFSGSMETQSTASLYTAQPDGQSLVQAFQSDDYLPFYLYWSPDSNFVSFLSNSLGGQSLALHLAPALGGESQVLLTGQPFYWSWSSQAREMVIHTGGAAVFNESARLAIVRLNGEVQVDELNLRPTQFQAPAWSPSSSQFVLAAESPEGNQALLLVNANGTVERELTQLDGTVAFDWSPDGQQLAYISSLGGTESSIFQDLSILDMRSNLQRSVAQDRILAFFWSPDGKQIAYLSITAEQPGGAFLIAQRDTDFRMALKIIDLQSGSNRTVATFIPTRDFLGVLPFFDQYQRSGTFWSPDGQAIVFAGLDQEGQAGIYVVNVSGNEPPRKIADGELAFWSWQ